MTYLTDKTCKNMLKKCIATSIKLLSTMNDLKTQNENENENHHQIENIKKKLIEINNIIVGINNYMSINDN
jgi:hypothetical protein